MNKIFKVIWSKSKQCYVVVSEIAKNKTGKKKIVVAGIFAALAMVGTMQHAQAVDGPGRREGWPSGVAENGYAKYIGTAFDPKKGLVVGPNMGNNDTTRANGNVATVAIGAHSNATGSSSVAIGGAAVNGAGAIGLGWSTANGDNSVALGGTGSTIANGNNAFAASGGNANGESATAIGSSAIADGRGGVAVGWNAESKVNAVGIGFNAKAKANNTIAIGVEANNDKANAISNNYSSVSIGVATRARAVGSMAMGVSADASGKYSIALGSGDVRGDYTDNANYPKATGEKAIAIGYNSNSSNTGATAIGAGATASGTDSFAGGSGTAGGDSSIAIGKGASITTPTAGTTVGGQDSIAMGTGASANQHSSVTIGAGSTSDGVRNITIGPKASASGVDSIAIGNGGVGGDKNNTGVGGNGNTYTINVNGISTNVYYGVKSVDDGSIAFGNRANAAKGGLAIGTVSIADGGIAVGQSVLSKNGVAIGSAVSATVANAVAMGSKAEASSVGAVAIGGYSATDKTKAQGNNALAIGASAVTNGNETIAIGKSANASNANAVAVGKNANASKANAVALGSDSTTDTNATRQANTTINSITYNFAGATSDTGMQVSVGAAGKERQIKNVAAGEVSATSTDAINGSQLFAVASQIKPQLKYVSIKSDTELDNANNDGATADKAIAIGPIAKASSKSAVAIGNTSTASSENAIAIGNNSNSSGVDSVAIGPSSVSNNVGSVAVGKDAKANGAFTVALGGGNWQSKGAQANGVGTIALGTYTRTKENTNYQTAVGFESKTDAESATAIGYKAVASGKDSVALGTGASTTGQDALTFGHNSQANGDSSLAMGIGAQANSNNAIALGYQTNSNSTNSTNGVFIGSVAGKETNGVGNIGIGSNTGNKIIGDNNVSIGTGAGSVTATNVYASESIMLGTQAGAINSTSTSPINNVIAIGKGSSGGANSTIAIGQNASSTNQNSIAIGTNASAPAYNGVAIGSFSVANTEGGTVEGYNANASRTDKYAGLTGAVLKGNIGAVSIGSGGTMTRQIKNLAAGTADTDAVNVAQLKSVNLAFKGNAGTGDVNLAANPLTIKGNDSYITTNASGNTITISANQKDIHVISGTANADTGVANAKNVATAINDAISQNKYKWYLTADNDTAGSRSTIDKEGTVKFSGDPNITVARSGNTITSSLNKIITVDTVKASKSVIAGSGNDQITLDGTSGTVKGKTFSGQSFVAGNNVLSNTTLQIGSATNGDNNVTISRDGFSSKAGTKTAKFGATGIDAGGQVITNVTSGGNVGTNAANITDVKNYVGKVALNIQSNSKTGTINLEQGALGVTGANGIRTDLGGTGNSNLIIGLDKNTVNATTNGIGLSSDSGTMLRKFLKDGNADFKISGDGGLVTTSGTTTGVQVSVDKSKVKDLAVEAVTVSKANTVDNPITVTSTAGTNSKEYAIGIDTSKLAAKTEVTYRANNAADANAKKVSLSKGLNFVDGDSTVATVDNDGKVSFDLNTATKNQINTNTTDIAANKGKIATNTTNIAANTTAIARNISLGADSGVKSSQSLSTGDVAFNVKGATGDYISTKMNGNTVEISTTRATINSDANTGAASVTGNDGLATAKNVADAINKAADAAKAGSTWNVSTNGDTSTKVSGGDTVDFTGDNNITVDRNNKTISTSLNKNLTDMNSISLVNPRGESIFLNGRDGSIKAGKAEFKDNVGAGSTITSDQLSFTNGVTGANEVTTTIALDTVSIQSGPNGSALTSKYLMFSDEDGNNAEGSAKGMAFQNAAGKSVQFTIDEINAGGNKIQEVAEGTDDTDAVNVKQLKDTVASQTLTYRANTAADADAKSVKLSKGLDFVDGTMTKATVDNDGKVTFDINDDTKTKINDSAAAVNRKVSLGADSGTASSQSLKDGDVAFNVKGATGDYVSTNMNGNTVEISTTRATINSDANTGVASVTGNDGLATAKNVADAINKAADAAKAGAAWNLTTNSSTTDKTSVQGGDTVDLINGDNIVITQDGTDKKKITVATKKDLTVDSVTAGNTVINTSGLTNGTTAITGSGITTDKVTVGGISLDKTDGINAGGKAISNVASGGTTDTNAANIGDVKQAVANLSQNLNITDGTNNGTVDLKNQKLNIAGANGVTATVNNQTITVGLDTDTVNATTKGIGLTADTGATGNKYLKDGDVSFAVTGDGNLVSTSATTAGVKVAVDAAKVKDLAIDAVTVSKAAQADNPITVTPTVGTNSKDYAIGIDTTKLAGKTDLTYRANNDTDANAKKVSLAKGLNFVNGTLATASIDNDGAVKYDVNTATITAGTDGTVTGPTTDGVATAQNVADAINAAKKASKTEITANTGEAANATTGNVTLTSTTAADGHTIYDVKLNDKVTLGTATNAVTIDGTTGKVTAKNAGIGGITVDGDNKHVTGLSNTTWNGTATTGRAATEDQLKAVADTAKATTDAVNLKFSGDTNTAAGVVNLKDDTFNIVGDGKYVTTDANGKDLTVKVSEAEVKKSAVAAVTVSTDTTDANNPISVTPTTSADGTTKDYKVTIDGTKIANKTNLSYKANDGTAKQVSLADGLNFKNGTLTTASIDDNGVVKYDVNTAAITTGADGTITGPTTDGVATAKNVADAINAAKKASKTEVTANTGEAANATTGNVSLTSTTAADGHTIYDVKLNDKVTLGTGANAVTIDGTTGAITGKTATIGGVTVNGTANTIGGLSNTTWNGTATTGRAATEDQLKAVADAAGSQTWEITADKKAGTSGAQTGTKENAKVGKDDTVSLIAGENLTVDQTGKNFTYSLNKDLVKMNSATFEATGGKTTVIKGDSIVQTDGANVNTSNATSNTITDGTNTSTITAGKAQIGTVGIDGVASKIATGGANAVVVNGADGTVKTGTVTVTGGTTNDITGLSNTTLTATDFATKGRAATEEQLKAATGATTLKVTGDVATNTGSINLKDDTFGIKGDGKYISTDVNGKNVNLTVSEAEVKKSAVAAVTVSTDTTDANNPLTVTPTTSADGTTKDYKVTIDGTKIANKTNLSYKANDGTAKQVSLADGLNFKNGTLTTASIDDNGVVKYDVNTASIAVGTDGTITGPTTDGVATAQNVTDAINAAKKASKTEITANTGEATNATTGNVTLTSTTAADGHTIYDVKLNDKVTLGTGANAVTVDGTTGKATIGSSTVDGVNNTFTTGGVSPVTLNGATGTITGKTANIGGVTVNGTANIIGGLSNTTWNGTATTGRAATEDQLKAVADAAGSQTWEITADKKTGTSGAQTGTKENAKVGKDDKVSLIAGENLTVDQAGKNFTYSLNTDLVKMNSATFLGTGANTTVITGDSITQTAGTQTNTSTADGNTVADGTKSTKTTADGQVIKDGAKSNKSTVDNNVIDDGNGNVNTSNATSNTITDGTNTTATTSSSVTVKDNAGNSTVITKDNVTTGVGANKITLDGTAGKATIGSSIVDGVNNTFTTGGANAVTMNGAAGTVKTGTVTVTGGTTNDITGLSNTTVNSADFATKGRAATEEQLKAATGATTLKFTGDVATNTGSVNLKDDIFGIKGDGKYISTDVNGKNVNLTVSEAEVKKSAVAAVTVSTDTTDANNPLTVTPTTSADGTTKDYKVTIDGTKIANKTNLSYKANNGTAKQVSLADGLDFTNGTLTTASIDDKGVVKYDVNTASITAGTDGTITGPTTDGVATAKNVADAINAAKKASKTEITANTGEAANATIGNVSLTSTTAADGHTIYDVKLNDKVTLGTGANAVTIDGTAGKAAIGSSIVDGVNNTFTTGGASPVTLNGATGTITGKTANIGGVTVDGTNNHVMGLANKDWTPGVTQAVSGRAATEDQLQKVSDAVGAGWKVNTGKITGSTGESNGAASTKVASGEEVQFQAGNNLIVDQNGKTVAYSLNKALKDLESATFNGTGTNKTVITGDSITQTAGTQTNTSTAGGNTIADGTKSTKTTADGQVIKDGTKTNTSTVDENTIIDGTKSNKSTVDGNTITDGTNTTATTSSSVTVKDNAGNSTIITKDNITTGVGGNKITLDGTAGKATIGSSIVDGVNNTFTTGGTNAVALDGGAGTVKTGTITVTGGTTNDITGLSNTTVTATDFATKGRAATEEQLKAVGEQTWQITADKDTATSGAQTGTKKDAKVGKDDKVQLIAGENMTVNQNERDFTFTLNKDLVKMNSATFLGTGTNTTVITGDSITQTAGTQTNTSTAAGNTVANGANSTATTAAGTTVTTANGNTNYAADGVRINTTGKTPVSLTDAGLDNGNNVIKNVASGHVNNDATDNTNAANIADVKKATTTVTANAGEVANATTGNVTLTSTAAADGHTIYDVKLNDKVTLGTGANAVMIDGTAGKATVGTAVVDGVNNTITTGGASPVTLNGATGTIIGKTANIGGVTVDGTNNHVMGLANKNWTPGVTQAVSGRAATEDQLQKVSDAVGAGWKVNTGKVTGSTGESNGAASTKVASGEEVQFQAGNNLIVDQNGKTVAYSLNKALKDLESATFNGTGTNKTVITGDSITQTAGTQTNTSTAAGNTVADGTKSTKTTADGQVIKDGTKTNTSTVDENTIVDGAKSNKTTVDSNVINDGNGNVNTSNATSNTITDGTNTVATTSSSVTVKDNAGNSTVITKDNITTGVGANKIILDGAAGTIKTGTVTVTGGTTNDITGLSNTTVTATDFATKGRAATEEQLKAVGEQTWQITADKKTGTSGAQTGLKENAKVGKDDKVSLIAGENLTVDQAGKNFTYSLNSDLVKMNSATFLGTGTNTTVITGDSITQTAGSQTNTSTAGGNTVADGTKSTEITAAGQVIKDGAKSNKSTVDKNVIDDGTGNVNTSNATSNTITDGTNTSTIAAGKATIGSSIIDGVNNTFTTGGASPVTLDGATGTITGKTANIGGVTVDGTNNHVMGLANKDWTPGVTQAVSGRAATEDQLQKVSDAVGAGWKVNTGKVTGSTGESNGAASTKVASGEEVQFQAGNNLIVDQNGKTVAYSLNKALKDLESATFNGTGTNKTVINGDSITQTAGTQTNTSTAAGNTVADGTKSTETTAAGQVIKDGAKSNKSTVDNNVIDDGNGNVNTSNATSNTITDGTNTSTVTAGKATIGSSIIDGVNNTFTTGGADAVTLDGATGTITGTTANIGGVTVNGTAKTVNGLSNTTWNGTAVSGRAATEDQLKAVGEQTWQITADKDATTSGAQTGTKKDAKVGKDNKVQLIAGENMTINQNERDFTFTLNKDLVKMNSATFLGTDTNKTVITGDSITQTAGTQTNTSTAGGNTVADGTKSTKTTADGQVIKDGTKTNTSTVDENTIVDGIKSNKSTVDGNTITDGTNTTETTSSSVTVKDNAGNSTVITKDSITTGVGGNKITLDGTAGKATIGSSIIDGVNKTFTTGGANAVTMDGVAGTIKTGTVTVTGGTTNDITGLSNTTVNSADFATKGRAATEEQLKAVGEQTWQITADKDATTSGAQTGTKKDAKVGKDNKVQLIAGENMTINQNERDFTFTLNKDLVKMNSATFLGTGSNTTVITGNSITQTAGTQTNTSTAAGNTVADGTKSTETTAAGQVIKDGAKTNKSTVDTNVIDDGNGNKNTSNATSNTITDGTNTSTITAGKANIGNIAVDGVNNKITMGNGGTPVTLDGANGHLDGLTNTTWVPGVTKATTGRAATEDQLQQVSDAVGAGWKVNTGTVAGSSGVSNGATSTKVSSGEEVKLQAGDNLVIDQNGKTVSYSLNKDLTKMNSATFEATGGKTTVIKGDSIVQTDGSKTNTSNAAGNTVVDGNKSTATTAAGTTITDGAKTNTSTADKNVINDGAGNTNTATATSNTLKNAAGDETKADAKGVTVKDAAGNNATFTKDGITITNTSKDTVSLTSNGLDNGKNKIINVADGTNPTDAVNVRQLDAKTKAATTELTANDGQHANSTNGNIMIAKSIDTKDGHTIYDTKLNDKITLGAADPTKAITVDGIAGTIKAGKDGNAVAINGTNGTVKAGDGTNAVAIDGVNGTIAVADKITLNGKDGKAGIGTVGIDGKDGIITTGGTNSVKVDGATGTVTGLTNKTWTPGSIVSGRAATEDQLKDAVADSGWKVAVGKDGSGKSNVVGTSPEKIKAEETVTFKAGNNMMVTQTGKSISYAVNPELTNMTSATFTDTATGNTTVMNSNGITITPSGANPTNPYAGPVSLTKDGLNNGNNQIKGVAPGTDPTDAVNVSQLNASNANTSQAINQLAGEVQHVGAHAAAMAALKPIQYDPLEPTQVMAGVGNYRGETAAALGLAHYTNENTMFNVGVSVGGNHNMVNAGVTHKFGYSPEKKNIPDRYKAGPISSVYVMQDEVSSLKKENAEQKYVIADQAARLTTLEAENEQQRRELAETKKGLDDLKAAVDKLLASKG